jgi:hypothetical protein
MRFKMLHKTCIALILTIGFGLSSANASLLIIDWTGECDDCQGKDGPNSVPLAAMDDGFYQTVYGQLILSYAGLAEEQGTLTKENFVSFYYGGSNILTPYTFTADDFSQNKPGINTSFRSEFSTTIITHDDGTLGLNGFSLTNLLVSGWTSKDNGLYRKPEELITLTFGSVGDNSAGDWNINVNKYKLITIPEIDPCTIIDGQESCSPPPSAQELANILHSCTDMEYWSEPEQECLTAPSSGGPRDIGYSSVFYNFVEVPEPSTFAIFALGLMGLASRRFKKQA